MDQDYEKSQLKLITKEFAVLSLDIAKGQTSCPQRLVLRGRLKQDLPGDANELKTFFKENDSPWSIIPIGDSELVEQTRAVFQNMDIIAIINGAGYIECLSAGFKSPILTASQSSPLLSSFTYKYWHAGEGGYDGTRWVSTEETQMYIIRTNEMVYWNRKGLRLKIGEKLKVDKKEGFLRTRLVLLSGKLNDENQNLQGIKIIPIEREKEFECIDECACVLLWI